MWQQLPSLLAGWCIRGQSEVLFPIRNQSKVPTVFFFEQDEILVACESLSATKEVGAGRLDVSFNAPQRPARIDEVRAAHDFLEETLRIVSQRNPGIEEIMFLSSSFS